MGELLPKGQPAVELAANQRLVALVPRAVRTTVRPKPMSHHADRQPDHCPLKEKGGLGGLLRELNLSSSVSPTRTSQLVPPKSKH